MAAVMMLWPVFMLLLTAAPTYQQQPSCIYAGSGSRTGICTYAIPSYFRTTSYTFDRFDETVRCVNCNLTTIESNTFDISRNQIKTLDLNSSKIVTLKRKAFIGLVFLKRLLLPNNQIKSLSAETFLGINTVEFLDMQNNELIELVRDEFKELTNLRQLNLRNNRITNIENGSFNGLTSLEELDLSNNNIAWLDGIFTGLHRLRNLNIAKNSITIFATDIYSGLPELRYLNLSHNEIEVYIKTGVFALKSLHTLDLSYNNLKYSNCKLLINQMPRLAFINITKNPWPCYLDEETQNYFRENKLEFVLDKQYDDPNLECDVARPVNIPIDKPELEPRSAAARLVLNATITNTFFLYMMGLYFICAIPVSKRH